MSEEEAIKQIKAFTVNKTGLQDTFAYSLANLPQYEGLFDFGLAETRSYGETLKDHLVGMMEPNHLHEVYSDSLWAAAEDWPGWFKLNVELFEFFESIINQLP